MILINNINSLPNDNCFRGFTLKIFRFGEEENTSGVTNNLSSNRYVLHTNSMSLHDNNAFFHDFSPSRSSCITINVHSFPYCYHAFILIQEIHKGNWRFRDWFVAHKRKSVGLFKNLNIVTFFCLAEKYNWHHY